MKKLFLLGGACIVILVVCAGSHKVNTLTRAFQHEGTFGDKVVLYFSSEPIFNQVAQKPFNENVTDQEQFSLFLPLTTFANAQVQKLVERINSSKRPFYTVHIEQVPKPIAGIKVTLTYNPAAILFNYETFNAVHTHKGIVFEFHNKEKLNEIQYKTDRLLKLAVKKKPLIVVDCGHGGSDEGAISASGIKEKEITFKVGSKLATLLQKNGYAVQLTRADDVEVPVDQRTTIANRVSADLLVSIHANASLSDAVSGIETYYSPSTMLKDSGLFQKHESLKQLCQQHDQQSYALAQLLHKNTLNQVNNTYPLVDRRVKSAICQVLFGAQMPAALVEIGFVSNPSEARFLAQESNQTIIARGLCNGVDAYCKQYL